MGLSETAPPLRMFRTALVPERQQRMQEEARTATFPMRDQAQPAAHRERHRPEAALPVLTLPSMRRERHSAPGGHVH